MTAIAAGAVVRSSPIMAGETTLEEKFSENAENEAQRRLKAIEEEIAEPGTPAWAGAYYQGDGLGVGIFLTLAPKAGFVFEWHGCVGVYDRNFGPVTLHDHEIRLEPTFPNERMGFQGIVEQLIPVTWGERNYLIPSNDVIGFCNEVNLGAEPRADKYGLYLLRRGDEEKYVQGPPALPQKYLEYLLREPIEGEIVEVGKSASRRNVCDWDVTDVEVTLNVGSKAGLRKGMQLVVVKPDDLVQWVIVSAVAQDQCHGIMTQVVESESAPQVGWRLSTRARWNGLLNRDDEPDTQEHQD